MTDGHPDYTVMSGAEFQRSVGVCPEKWAAAFLAAYAAADHVRTDADRLAFVASWLRDAMMAAVDAAPSQIAEMMDE